MFDGESVSELASEPPCPNRNAAPIRIRNASVFIRLVRFCVVLPQTTPRHCKAAKTSATVTAMGTAAPAIVGNRITVNWPINNATAAVEPQVEIQSLQPTTKPAYSPSA